MSKYSIIDEVNGAGLVIGIAVWLTLVIMVSSAFACADARSCDGGDLAMSALLGLGFVGPAFGAAVLGSALFQRK